MTARRSWLGTMVELDTRPRVLAADDDAAFGALVVQLIDAVPGLASVGVVCSGEAAVEMARELEPDLVLMDVVMPGIGGIGAARMIKDACSATVVVLISTTHPDDLPREASECRADEIVWKAELRPALLEEIWRRHQPETT